MNTFLAWSLSIYLIVADPQLLVFKKAVAFGSIGVPLTSRQTYSINSMITLLNNDGTALTWDGTWTGDESTLITLINSGNYQVLLALNPHNEGAIWSSVTQTAIESAFDSASNSIDRFIIWDRYANNNPNVPGMNGLVSRVLTTTICPIINAVPPSTGPAPDVGCWTGNYASHGSLGVVNFFNFLANYPEGVAYYAEQPSKNPTHVHYCFKDVNVMYSASPMDYYLHLYDFNSNYAKGVDYFVNTMSLLMNSDVCDPYADCPACVSDCTDMPWGDYPSCDAQGNVECDSATYASCVGGIIYDDRPCPATQVWNAFTRRCGSHSSCPCSGGDNTPLRCGECVDSCVNVDDGHYTSCSSDCGVYASCSGGVLHDNRPCPGDLIWNDAYKLCTKDTLCQDSPCYT